ncbi:MAG: hypothetical protein AB7E76_11810 [Deferribacterales bacterium]
MRSLRSFRYSLWVIICLNVLMALGSIWIFMRMSPAISLIIERNEHSLQASEDMLTSVAVYGNGADPADAVAKFTDALVRAENNITEEGEVAALNTIRNKYTLAFGGDRESMTQLISSVRKLSAINRNAMISADYKAKQIGSAGAWAIVFMATAVFLASMIIIRYYRAHISGTMEEINTVLEADKAGDVYRRCTVGKSDDANALLGSINRVLDQKSNNRD